jgi:transcriptional regulator GlxA family with amidase domain
MPVRADHDHDHDHDHGQDGRDGDIVAVVVGDGAGLLEVAAPARVFDVDLTRLGVPRWDVRMVAGEPGPLTSTAGVRLDVPYGWRQMTDVLAAADIVIVPSWRPPGGAPPRLELLDAIRAAHRRGATIAGLCLGAFVVAAAGLLAGRRATTHWQAADALQREHGDLEIDPGVLYVDDGDVLTSAGSAAGIDACLHLVRRRHGAAAANAVARSLVVAPHRAGGQAQYVERPVPQPTDGDPLAEVITHCVEHLADRELDIDALAARANMSRRTFDRQFRARTGSSPLSWLIGQRVLQAQRLLETSSLDIDAVASACGFGDGVSMRPHFRRIVGVAPQAYRRAFSGH